MTNFDKQVARVNKIRTFKKNFRTVSRMVLRVVLFPLVFFVWAKEKYVAAKRKKQSFSTKRAKHILDKYLPRAVAIIGLDEDNGFLIEGYRNSESMLDSVALDCFGFNPFTRPMYKDEARFVYRFEKKIMEYIANDYTISGWEKFIGNTPEFIANCYQYDKYSPERTKHVIYFKKGVDK